MKVNFHRYYFLTFICNLLFAWNSALAEDKIDLFAVKTQDGRNLQVSLTEAELKASVWSGEQRGRLDDIQEKVLDQLRSVFAVRPEGIRVFSASKRTVDVMGRVYIFYVFGIMGNENGKNRFFESVVHDNGEVIMLERTR